MYPLLISAGSSLATTLIDKWAAAKESKPAASTANFAATLSKSTAASTETQITSLRQKLLDTPEVQTLLGSADPAKQPTLSLSADGTLTARSVDGRTTPVLLSQETAASARELATLTAASTAAKAAAGGQKLPAAATAITIR